MSTMKTETIVGSLKKWKLFISRDIMSNYRKENILPKIGQDYYESVGEFMSLTSLLDFSLTALVTHYFFGDSLNKKENGTVSDFVDWFLIADENGTTFKRRIKLFFKVLDKPEFEKVKIKYEKSINENIFNNIANHRNTLAHSYPNSEFEQIKKGQVIITLPNLNTKGDNYDDGIKLRAHFRIINEANQAVKDLTSMYEDLGMS